MSVDEGRVEEELKRADDEELSLCRPLEDEVLVPALPLEIVSNLAFFHRIWEHTGCLSLVHCINCFPNYDQHSMAEQHSFASRYFPRRMTFDPVSRTPETTVPVDY